MEKNITYNMDALAAAKLLPDQSVDCIVTSPPYYGLRDYGVEGQIGLEDTPDAYIQKLVSLFHELRRVLKDQGTVWINIADSYAGSGRGVGDTKRSSAKQQSNAGSWAGDSHKAFKNDEIKPKDLIGIPWMLAFALRADGWYWRADIVWHKPNSMPESVTDRPTKAHEYILLFAKSSKYYFNAEAIAEPVADTTIARCGQNLDGQQGNDNPTALPRFGGKKYTENPAEFYRTKSGNIYKLRTKRNKRSVWTVTTKPQKEAHFATFPEDLITPCILAGCPEGGGIVLDPFNGTGTTRIVANKLNRNAIGFELNPKYIRIEERRRRKELGIFNI